MTDIENKLPAIWKLSHGRDIDKVDEYPQYRKWLDENKYLSMHEETSKGQAEKFRNECKVGDIVNLGSGGNVQALVRVTGEMEASPEVPEWMIRKYEEIILPKDKKFHYPNNKQKWSPSGYSTFHQVPLDELKRFESEILKENYDIDLKKLLELWEKKGV